MNTLKTIAPAPRGFALIAAIGVLAVLAIIVFAAASSAQFTANFASLDGRDYRLCNAVEAGLAQVLARDLPAWKQGDAPRTVTLPAAPAGYNEDLVVTATIGLAPSREVSPPDIAARAGDVLVAVQASPAQGRHGMSRQNTYLVNLLGHRPGPILLEETRK